MKGRRMAQCWEQRPCDEEMQSRCLHVTTLRDRCPAKCAFAICDRPTFKITSDPALIFDPYIDRAAAINESCTYCVFFLRKGPVVSEAGTQE